MGLARIVILAALAGVCGCEGCDPEEPVDAAGTGKRTLTLAWTVTDLGDVELACDRIDAQFVTVSFYRMRTGEAFNEVFDCFRKTGTRELDEGDYQIGFDLADRFGTLVTVPSRRVQIAGDAGLDAKFRIDPVGTLIFTLDAAGLAMNCAGAMPMTGWTLELYRADTSCQTSTLTVESGPPYTVSCGAPNTAGCIEKDQDVSGVNLPAGEYRIRVVGLRSGMPCWLHDQQHRVRAARLVRTEVLALMKTCN